MNMTTIVTLQEMIEMKASGTLKKFAEDNELSLTAMYNCINGERDYKPRGSRKSNKKRTFPVWNVLDSNWIYDTVNRLVGKTAFEFGYGTAQKENLRDFLLDFVYSLNLENKENKRNLQGYAYRALQHKINDFRKKYDNIVYSYYDTECTMKNGRPLAEYFEG